MTIGRGTATTGPTGPMSRGRAMLARELRLSVRHGADTLAVVLFFLLAASLFPLAVGPAPETLGRIAPGTIWVCALLAALLPLDRLFGADHEDGSLDQLLLSGLSASAIALLPGTILLSLLGTMGAAIVLGARRGGVLLPLLVLPLATPVLIFGVAAADAASGGLSPRPHLLLLAALLAAALPLCPLAAGAALRLAAE